MSFTVRKEITYDTAPECYKANGYSFVGTAYDMWKINGNCTHYAYARSCEIAGKNIKGDLMDWFPDAGLWFKNSKWKTGTEPKVGAIVVTENHVAIIEKIYSDGSCLISQSAYKRFIFGTIKKKLKVGALYDSVAGKVLGFIYNPYVEAENNPVESETKKDNRAIAVEVIRGLWGNGNDRKTKLTMAGYDYSAIQALVNKYLIMRDNTIAGAYGNGSTRKVKLGTDYTYIQELVNKKLKK